MTRSRAWSQVVPLGCSMGPQLPGARLFSGRSFGYNSEAAAAKSSRRIGKAALKVSSILGDRSGQSFT
jgi:hypothetical protein